MLHGQPRPLLWTHLRNDSHHYLCRVYLVVSVFLSEGSVGDACISSAHRDLTVLVYGIESSRVHGTTLTICSLAPFTLCCRIMEKIQASSDASSAHTKRSRTEARHGL